ncbi:hypothetical protein FRC05_001355 [Tulasnella sp. 425]|nr:hypothetical protein FRC05_001355 [Tulasnella sp. 425]
MSSSGKTIILAFDGTSNQFGSNNTNVIRLFSLLEKDHPDIQILYYQPGIGTCLAEGTAWSPALKSLMEVLDKAFARYLDIHVRST